MRCETIKRGTECIFMKKSGCSYNGSQCYPVVDDCEGCTRIMEFETGRFCASFPYPSQKWQKGACPMSSHVKKGTEGRRAEDQPFEGFQEKRRQKVNTYFRKAPKVRGPKHKVTATVPDVLEMVLRCLGPRFQRVLISVPVLIVAIT